MCNGNNIEENSSCECLREILSVILKLQECKEKCENFEGCSKPFLGPTPSVASFNTRPVNFYTCCNGEQWILPYTLNGVAGTSGVFRVENLDDCCCTCRILAPNTDTTEVNVPYVATDSFFTINLNCVGALKCLADTFVPCI